MQARPSPAAYPGSIKKSRFVQSIWPTGVNLAYWELFGLLGMCSGLLGSYLAYWNKFGLLGLNWSTGMQYGLLGEHLAYWDLFGLLA